MKKIRCDNVSCTRKRRLKLQLWKRHFNDITFFMFRGALKRVSFEHFFYQKEIQIWFLDNCFRENCFQGNSGAGKFRRAKRAENFQGIYHLKPQKSTENPPHPWFWDNCLVPEKLFGPEDPKQFFYQKDFEKSVVVGKLLVQKIVLDANNSFFKSGGSGSW